MKNAEIPDWIDTYIRAQELQVVASDHPLWWAIERFFDLQQSDPEACWAAIIEIVKRRPADEVLSALSAGPLESLIEDHGALFIDRIEDEAHRSVIFSDMLKRVWKSGDDEVWARIQRSTEQS